MAAEAPRKPDYFLQVKDKLGGSTTRAGAAWKNRKGGITIKLNPAVVLSAGGLRDCYLTLWPNQDAERPNRHTTHYTDPGVEAEADLGVPEDCDDDIPF